MADRNELYTRAKKQLEELIELKKTKTGLLNEAETRKFFIDKIIEYIMEWPPLLEKLENWNSEAENYYDYLLQNAENQNKIIIEAKKEGKYLEIEGLKDKVINIDRLKTSSKRGHKEFYKAIKQAVSYARTQLAPFAMVCNGHQVAITLSNFKPGYPDEYGNALIYYSLEDLAENLEDFLEYVSFESLNNPFPRLSEILSDKTSFSPTSCVLKQKITSYPRKIIKTEENSEYEEVTNEIKNVCGHIIKGISNSAFSAQKMEEYLDNCYVTPTEYKRSEADGIKLGKTFTKEFASSAGVDIEYAFKKGDTVNPNLINPIDGEPIIILGNVGVGKSIFIDYLIYKEKFLQDKAYIARVRFTDIATFDTNSVELKVAEEIYRSLKENEYDLQDDGVLRDIYGSDISEIKRNFKGANNETISAEIGKMLLDKKHKNNLVQLVKDGLQRLKSHQLSRKMVVFLDDIDQKKDDIQREIYAFSAELMKKWGVHVSIVTMTPRAFHVVNQHKKERSPKSTGHTMVYTVIAPPVTVVFEKRLKFINRLINEKRLFEYGYSIQPDNKNTNTYINTLIETLGAGKKIGGMVAELAGDNIRRASEVVSAYVFSSNTKTVEYDRKEKKFTSIKKIEPSEFLSSLLKGENMDYDDENNEFMINLFSISQPDSKEHFLSLAILNRLTTVPFGGGTYHDTKSIQQWASKFGFSDGQILNHITHLEDTELIESVDINNNQNQSFQAPKAYRIRSRGHFHIQLASNNTYTSEMAKVTPILDKEFYMKLDIEKDNGPVLVDYLKNIYEKSALINDPDFLPPNILFKSK